MILMTDKSIIQDLSLLDRVSPPYNPPSYFAIDTFFRMLYTEFMNRKEVLDKGFVELVDHMGSDSRIVQAARVSYGEGTKSLREDKALIKYLYENKHTSPFEHVLFTFHVKAPIFVARQWMRHRTASINEISGRYSVLSDEFYVPENVCEQDTSNRQGSGDVLSNSEELRQEIKRAQDEAYESYKNLIAKGSSRETARIVLPLGIYTHFYWTINLHNLLHFVRLRIGDHAQKEIRLYAGEILKLVKDIVPITTKIFMNSIQVKDPEADNEVKGD